MSRSPSPVAFRRQQAGFVHAADRNRCDNCSQIEMHPPIGEIGWKYRCQRVGFTTPWSVCNHWTKTGATPA